MSDITSLNRISSLSAYLHDDFVSGGEIPDADHIARLISDCEPDFLSQLTDEEILVAVHNATDSTCDSYIINASDSTEWTQEERDDETAKWEALRPKRIREKQIVEISTSNPINSNQTMKLTLTRSDIANSLESMHGTSFSHYGSLALADYLLELEDSTGEEQEFDAVAIRCGFTEYESAESWAGDYFGDDIFACMGIDLDGGETEDEREKLIRDYIRDHGQLIEFTGGIIVSSF